MNRTRSRAAVAVESLESRQVLSAAPTAELQYALELVNLVRTNPAAAAERLTGSLSEATQDALDYFRVDLTREKAAIAAAEPRQPLAWNEALAQAAQAHSDDMARNGFQSHTGSDGSSVEDRIRRAGYGTPIRAAENAFAYAESIDQAMQAFTLDWGVADQGHRRNLLEPANRDDSFQEIGIGIARSNRLTKQMVVTQKLARRADASAQLLGVVYKDNDKDGFYSIGEGQADVTIRVEGASGTAASTRTASPGGYQIPLAPGRYRVRALIGGREVQSRDVTIGSQNVKLDFVLSDTQVSPPPAPPSRPVVASNPTPAVNPRPTPAPPTVRIATRPVTNPTPTVVNTILTNSTVQSVGQKPQAVQLAGAQITLFDSDTQLTWNTWRPAARS
ncbi:MAG: hypothetical protein KatS3mg108_1151 [Isosphaeraceae bacterium]|jgi:uncharacterized protein YkwD|nr:MAG: hypothetical protein KatS3mg108_1151 [Isosphaeraceae bacterium]